MINIQQFKELQKKSSHSYHQQKAMIKKVISGRPSYCPVCGGILALQLIENIEEKGIYCAQGCTKICLDIE